MIVKELAREDISAGENAQRFEVDEEYIQDLSGSIRTDGLLQPIIVRKKDDGYVVVAGHSRFEACCRVCLPTIPCIIRECDDKSVKRITFAENFYRQDLSAVELAAAIATEYSEGTMTIKEMAFGFRKSEDWVKRQIAMCGWPEDVLDAIHNSGLSVASAASLAQIDNDSYRTFLLRNAVDNGATARTTAGWLQAYRSQPPSEDLGVAVEENEGRPLMPAAPMGPCLMCSEVLRVDAMSHVPLCPACIRAIREAAAAPSVVAPEG